MVANAGVFVVGLGRRKQAEVCNHHDDHVDAAEYEIYEMKFNLF